MRVWIVDPDYPRRTLQRLPRYMGIRRRPRVKPPPPIPEPEKPPMPIDPLQSAIDALPPDGGVVSVPVGINTLTQPLRVKRGRFTLQGQGRYSSFISHGGWQGPVAVFGPTYPNFTLAPSLANGPGNSVILDGTNEYYLNLRDSPTMELDGLQKFCIELFYRPTQDTTNQFFLQNLVASQGRRLASEPISKTFTLDHYEGNRLRASLNVGGVLKAIESPRNALTIGNVHHLTLTYDGSMVRLFINGVLQASATATGAISQQPHEDITLGPAVYDWPETVFLDNMAKGEVDGLRISKTERYAANFTLPVNKPSLDSNTLLLLNFDNFNEIFVIGQTGIAGNGIASQVWLPLRRITFLQVTEIDIRDVQFQGTGPFFWSFSQCRLTGVYFLGNLIGPFFWLNSFLTHFRDVKCLAGGSQFARSAFIASMSGALSFDGINEFVGSAYPFVSTGGSALMDGMFALPNMHTRIGMIFKGRTGGNSNFIINQLLVDDEPFIPPGFVRPIESNVALDDVTALFHGGTLELVASMPGPRSSIWIDRADASFFGTKFTNGTSSPIVQFKSPTANRLVAIRDSFKPTPNVWADDLSKCLIENS